MYVRVLVLCICVVVLPVIYGFNLHSKIQTARLAYLQATNGFGKTPVIRGQSDADLASALHQLRSAQYLELKIVPGHDLLVCGAELLDDEEVFDERERYEALFRLSLQQMKFDQTAQNKPAWDDAHRDAINVGHEIAQDQERINQMQPEMARCYHLYAE